MNERYSRRALLKTLGVGAAMLPLLDNEWAFAAVPSSFAAPGGFPKRLVTVTWTNGVYGASKWFQQAGPLTAANLPAVLSPLAPWASKTLIPHGVNLQKVFDSNKYGGHFGFPCILTGTWNGGSPATANGPSIDTLVSNALTAQKLGNLQLNIGCRPYNSYTSWSAAKQPNSQEIDPYALFNRLFAGASLSASQIASIQARRKSVLDTVLTQLTAFQGRVGTDDKLKIQAHLDSIRGLEVDLATAQTPAGCMASAPTPAGLNFMDVNNYPSHVDFMMRLAAAAITCGVSRAITIDLINDGGGDSLTFPWLNITSPQYHTLSHAGAAEAARKTSIDTWFYTQVSTLLKALAATPEGTSTALDNTVVVCANDMQEGNNHYSADIPFVLIGSCGGFFKTGQVVALKGVPNNQLLTSLCHAMGLGSVASVGDTYLGDLDSSLT